MKNCWTVLGIKPTHDLDVIKNARRALVKIWHPDRAHSAHRNFYTRRCAQINAAFDEAIIRMTSVAVVGDTHTNIEIRREGPSFARAFLTNPLVWLSASGALLLTQGVIKAVAIPVTLFYGLGSVLALNFSRNMMRTCGRSQRSNWLLLVLASATALLISLHDMSFRTLGAVPAFISVIAGIIVLPLWIIGFGHPDN